MKKIILSEIPAPALDSPSSSVSFSDETMQKRISQLSEQLKAFNYDAAVIYGDLEHGSNFEYFTGFLPRFEEALLVVHRDTSAFLVLGNENLNKADKSRIKARAIHCPLFSLPNQPMMDDREMTAVLADAGIRKDSRVALIGWKMFTSNVMDNRRLFDVPEFIVKALQETAGEIENGADLLISPEYGIRTINNPNEIAFYEFHSSLASDCMLRAMDKLDLGVSEWAIGDELNRYGLRNTVVTIASAGQRFINANLYPTERKVELAVPVSLTVSYRGGLSSRAGYAVEEAAQLPADKQDYLERLAIPYFNAVRTWLENVRTGMKGADVYELVENVLPKDRYHWSLCPGHLTGFEEWLSSPVYSGSECLVRSGMIFQTDIIPSMPGYDGVSMESTVLVADSELQQQIRDQYPEMWQRFMQRRDYIRNVTGIMINDELLPMASTLTYLRPFLLAKNKALHVIEE